MQNHGARSRYRRKHGDWIVRIRTGTTADGAMGQLNTGILPIIFGRHPSNTVSFLKYLEGGGFAALHTPNTSIGVGCLWQITIQFYPEDNPWIQLHHNGQIFATIPGARLMRSGCLGCNLSRGQYWKLDSPNRTHLTYFKVSVTLIRLYH